MSTPTDPAGSGSSEPIETPDASGAETSVPETVAPEAAPTEAYPPVPPAPETPAADATAAYAAPAPDGAYGQAPYGQAPYGQAPYGQAPYAAAAPAGPDTRPKTVAWVSLGLAIAGLLLSLVGFIPLGWGSLVSVVIGGLLLLAAFVVSIIALVSRKQGGKPLGITALVLSVIGGIVWSVALVVSIAFAFVSTAVTSDGQLAPEITDMIEEETGIDLGDSDGEVSADYDEAAFVAEARPAFIELFASMDSGLSEDMIDKFFTDEDIVAIGQAMLYVGDEGREAMIQSFMAGADGAFDEAAATEFADAIYEAAQKHLQ